MADFLLYEGLNMNTRFIFDFSRIELFCSMILKILPGKNWFIFGICCTFRY